MKKIKAKFVKGVIGDDYGFEDNFPQIAFFGRSNAGKSSVINSLFDTNIVKISKIPGQTTEANFFLINNSFYFIDFPGYGYAKLSIKIRNKIINRIFWYIKNSNVKPKAVFLIIDAKVGLTSLDKEMIKILKENNHQIVIIANKIDKLRKSILENNFLLIKKENPDIDLLLYSAKTKKGKEELIEKIISLIK